MAILNSEGLSLEITNVVSYTVENIENMYEEFLIKLEINNESVFSKNIMKNKYELCGGNIESLISSIDGVLYHGEDEGELGFTEPDFTFEIKCDLQSPYEMEHYYFTFWVNNRWLSGYGYGGNQVGARFWLNRDELMKFGNGLKFEWNNRAIKNYEDKE